MPMVNRKRWRLRTPTNFIKLKVVTSHQKTSQSDLGEQLMTCITYNSKIHQLIDAIFYGWIMIAFNGQIVMVVIQGFVTAIQAIAWSITTNVAKGNIEKIIRQGDCILLKPIDMDIALLPTPRHLTADEYEKLLVAES